MDGERRAGRRKGGKPLTLRHARGASRDAGQNHALRQFGHGQLAAKRGGSCGEGRYAGGERVGNATSVQPPELLGERAVDCEVAGLKPRQVMATRIRRHEFSLDLVERQRRGIDDARACRAIVEQGARHDRAGIEADRAIRDEVAAAERDEVRSARPCAYEMYGHRVSSVSASAQVTGPIEIRGRISLALGPPAARAAASATDGTPASAFTSGDEDCVRLPAASSSAGPTSTRRKRRAAAAATIPASPPFPSEVAMSP